MVYKLICIEIGSFFSCKFEFGFPLILWFGYGVTFFFIFTLALSRWCISHRKKAKQIVETWDKVFSSSQREQRVSFLYLSNDILQNSRRKGSEFVNEFWKVLPAALRHVYENGDEYGKKAVTRLVCLFLINESHLVSCFTQSTLDYI